MMFAPVDVGKYATLKMTVETHDDPNASGMIEVEDDTPIVEAVEDEQTPEVEEPEPDEEPTDETEDPTETETEE